MRIAIMPRLAPFLAVLVFATPAMAQVVGALPSTSPTLRRAVTVTSEVVRIGDLVDNAGAAASTPIFRSPDFGTTGTVPTYQIVEALRSHDLTDVNTDGIREVEVARAGRMISVKDIQARIIHAFLSQNRFVDANNFVISFDRDVQPVYVEPSVTADLQVSRGYFDPHTGRFDIAFELPDSIAARHANLRYTGSLVETAETAILTRPLGRGEAVKSADVVIERKPKADIKGDAIGSLEQVIGLQARTALAAGQPLRQADLIKPERIKRAESVTLVYQVPGILLTSRGKAMESGSDGDVISVLNVQSNRTIQGTVTGPGRVTIPSATARIAANTTGVSQ
jgi:flagellar basal body P-ring formation protein FlgA